MTTQPPYTFSITEHLRRGNWVSGPTGERNRKVLLAWLGEGGALPTLEDLGREEGITRERARQIKNAALASSLEDRDWISEIKKGIQEARQGRRLPLTLSLAPTRESWSRSAPRPTARRCWTRCARIRSAARRL